MADDVKAAPKTDKVANAEQEISWIGARMREPSTYAGLSGLAAAAAIFGLIPSTDANELVKDITVAGMAIGGILGIVLPEASRVIGKFSKAAGAILLAIALASALHADPAMADNLPKRAAPPTAPGKQSLTANDIQQNPLVLLDQLAITDLQNALADANAQTPPDTAAANCYTALLALKASPAFSAPPAGSGVFYGIQKGRDLEAQIATLASPNGPLAQLNNACAAWTQSNLQTLIAIGGAVGLVANPAGAAASVASVPAAIAAFIAAHPLIP
jgi:hypothetical protein